MASKCEHFTSESRDSYKYAKKKTQATTRASCLERFLWKELYDEYIRTNYRLEHVKIPTARSEYDVEYTKPSPPKNAAAKEANIFRYPLYCTSAITLWNHEGDIMKDFKRRYSITRPLHLNPEKFG